MIIQQTNSERPRAHHSSYASHAPRGLRCRSTDHAAYAHQVVQAMCMLGIAASRFSPGWGVRDAALPIALLGVRVVRVAPGHGRSTEVCRADVDAELAALWRRNTATTATVRAAPRSGPNGSANPSQ